LTQEELAERSGVSVRTIRSLERDRLSTPRWSSLRALAQALGLDAQERQRFDRLAGGDEPPAAPGGGVIPVSLSLLVGREAEVSTLVEVVLGGTTRLITLTGVAGIGKTRLALAVAEAAIGRGRCTWWVPLSGVSESKYVLDAVAGALGVAEVTVEAIATRVGGQAALLVVDNLEHLDGVGGVVTELLGRVAEVTALVTSRAPIGLADEQVWPLRPLPVPADDDGGVDGLATVASVELLVDRVRRATPTFELNADTAEVVAEVCRRLDGLPLALELAAGSWRVLGADGVLAAISADPLEVHDLQGARPAVHRSLRNALEASYRLLADDTRDVLQQLSVFRGGWTIEAATAVVDNEAVLDHLDRLAALGLVDPCDDPSGRRFTMLPTIQTFAAAHAADAGVAEPAATRHATHYRHWVAQLQGTLEAASRIDLQRLRADGDNLRVALDWFADHDATSGLSFAIDLYRYWLFRGSMDEGLDWFETMLQHAGADERRPLAQLCAAGLANYRGRLTRSRRLAEQSLESYRRRGDAFGIALATGLLGDLDLRMSLEESVRHSREAAANLEATGDSYYLCWALLILSWGLIQLGELDEAEETARRSIAVARGHDHPYRLAAGLSSLAGILRLRGDLPAADRLRAESEMLITDLDDLHFGATWFAEWAVVAAGLGDIERARHLAAVALATANQRADRSAMGDALWAEGEVLLAAGEQAADSYTRAITCMGTHSMPLRRVEALTGLALSVDDADVAATATAAATTIRDEQHMVLPAAISARLDENAQRWASIIGAEQWTQRLEALTTRPHDELLHLLVGDRAAPPS
jgi:predicted ATPase/DNA-binding XRE family transcriptional regulator